MTLALLGGLIDNGALWFSAPAIAGTLYFLFSLVAGELGGDLDVDLDGDVDVAGDDPGGEFRAISLQTISAFTMGAGWMGLAALRLTDVGFTGSVFIALLTGLGVAWLLATVLKSLFKLQSSGNVSIGSAVGLTGEVYIAVPASGEGSGRVNVVIDGRRRELDAVQSGADPITTNARVRVSGVDATTNTITVERIEENA